MSENFPHLKKETDTPIQEAQRIPNKKNPKRPIPRPIIIKMAKVKDKERILKAAIENQESHTRELPQSYQLMFLQKLCRPEWSGMIYLKC